MGDGRVYGLHEDYKLCGNKGRDGFENWLMQTLMKDFGKDAAAQLHVEFHHVRTGNATNQLKPSEILAYCKQRWPETIAVAAK